MARSKATNPDSASSQGKRRNRAKVQKTKVVPKPATAVTKQATRKLDQVSRKIDVAAEALLTNLEAMRECLPDLLATEARRDCWRRFTSLAEAGVLHDLHTLAVALEGLGPENLPPPLIGVYRYARMAVTQLGQAFEVQSIHRPGDSLTITEDQRSAFDWSADASGELSFPISATILKSGWKAGTNVLVKPKAVKKPD